MIEFGHGTHVGMCRLRNEDSYYADAALGLFLVADGMGGYRRGDAAAAELRDGLVAAVRDGAGLFRAVREVAQRLDAQRACRGDASPMGSTLAALQLRDGHYEIAWVGDSRAYLLVDGRLRQVAHDRVLAQKLVESGQWPSLGAAGAPPRNLATQALGVTPVDQLRVGVANGTVRSGLRFLLCTDGLTEKLGESTLDKLFDRPELAMQECVDHLLLAALGAGGRDDVTAIAVRMH